MGKKKNANANVNTNTNSDQEQEKTPYFIATRRIYVDKKGNEFLTKKLNLLGRMYNNAVRHYKILLAQLRKDAWYNECLEAWKKAKDEDEQKAWSTEIFNCAKWYGLTEFNIHAYLGMGKNQSNPQGINIDILQKAGTNLYQAVKKALFSKKINIHYRKYGQTISMEAKKANSGIIYNEKDGTVKIMGRVFNLKPVRKNDFWLMEALCHEVRYCRVVKEFHDGHAKYFLQLVMEGYSPKKTQKGDGTCGIDQGTSNIAWVTDNQVRFDELAPEIRKYEKDIIYWQTVYERRRRMANPDCYNPNGTIKKGARFTVHTKGMERALLKLKSAYRKKSDYIRQCHGRLTNEMVSDCDRINIEPTNWKALAKRSKKETEKKTIKKTNGKVITKCKRKRRFGKSIGRHAPGLLTQLIKQKSKRYKIPLLEIDTKEFKASQYNHVTDTYQKPKLSDRVKKIGRHKVQRDCYSAYLVKHAESPTAPSKEACKKNFKRFLKMQGEAVKERIKLGDNTKTFGLKEFVKS